MKRVLVTLALVVAVVGTWGYVNKVNAQTTAVLQFTGNWAAHTSCVPTTGQTSICLASDGLWQSINGAAFTQLGGAAGGVTSIAVNGGTAQTGVVALTIPTKATSITTTTIQ